MEKERANTANTVDFTPLAVSQLLGMLVTADYPSNFLIMAW